MGLSFFIGIPDARSAILAALFALPWLALLGRSWLRQPWLWAAVAIAAVLFPVTIAWVQVPIQQGLNALWLRLLGAEGTQRYLLLVGLPSLGVASLVQEGIKLLVAISALRRPHRQLRSGLALGAAAGAGYGGFEAFWVFNQVFATGWSWATVQLNGPIALLPFGERLFAVPFHIGATALTGYGYAAGCPGRFFWLAVALHTLVNYAVLVAQAGLLGIGGVEVWAAAVAAVTIGTALWLHRRSGKGDQPAPRGISPEG